MEEEEPMFIGNNEYYLYASSESQDKENLSVVNIDYTEFVPGAKWMYSDYRSKNILKLKILHAFIYIFEILTIILCYSHELNQIYYFQSIVGFNIFFIMQCNSVKIMNFFINELGYFYLGYSLIVIIFYWTIRFDLWQYKIILIVNSVYFYNNISQMQVAEYQRNLALFLIHFKCGLLMSTSIFEVIYLFQEKYFEQNIFLILFVSFMLMSMLNNFSVIISSTYFFYICTQSNTNLIKAQSEISLYLNLVFNLIILFSV